MTPVPDELRPGRRGEPLPGEEIVFRLAKASKDGKTSEAAFTLSTTDVQSDLQSLSVWAVRLTTPEEAREFLEEKQDEYRLTLKLQVDRIRALRPEPDLAAVRSLDVVWDPLRVRQEHGTPIPDTRPDAEGHAGITGLMRPSGMPKSHYKSLRSQLTDMANDNLTSEGPSPETRPTE